MAISEVKTPDASDKEGGEMKVAKAEMPDSGECLILPLDSGDVLMEEIKNAEVGDRFTITLVEMSQEELDVLPEFDGW